MRWLIVGSLALPLLIGCSGEQREAQDQEAGAARQADTEPDETAQTAGQVGAEGGEAQGQVASRDGHASPWQGGATAEDESQPLAGTGAPGETPTPQQDMGARDDGSMDDAVLFGQQIEPHGTDQVGIVSGHVAAIGDRGADLTVERPDGTTVDLVIPPGALVTLDERPVGADELQRLREGDPIRAAYRAAEDGNVADRIEIPVGRVGQEPRQREAQQQDGQTNEPGAGRQQAAPPARNGR